MPQIKTVPSVRSGAPVGGAPRTRAPRAQRPSGAPEKVVTHHESPNLTAAQVALRVAVTLSGAVVMALGVALAVIASLGVQPLSALPAVGARLTGVLGFPLTLGFFTFVINAAFFCGELALLRGQFPAAQWLQLPLVFVFSAFIDVWLNGPLAAFVASGLAEQAAVLALSIVVTALGVQLQVMGNTLITPPEAFMALVSKRGGAAYGNVKVAFDVALMVAGVAVSLLLFGDFADVSVGTLLAALLTSQCVKVWVRALRPLERRLPVGRLPFRTLPLGSDAR